MYFELSLLFLITCLNSVNTSNTVESDLHFRVEPGTQLCFFETAKGDQMIEILYQVVDGQHGDLDINFKLVDPKGTLLVHDHKKASNSIIMDLEEEGDYSFCLDNTYSMMNSKLVFIYVLIEDKPLAEPVSEETVVSVVDEEGEHEEEEPVLEWMGTLEDGEPYYIEVTEIIDSLTRILKHVVSARHLLDLYGASKTRDNYRAFEETFVVDAWSGFQILFMLLVGTVQVYMIKKLFASSSTSRYNNFL